MSLVLPIDMYFYINNLSKLKKLKWNKYKHLYHLIPQKMKEYFDIFLFFFNRQNPD